VTGVQTCALPISYSREECEKIAKEISLATGIKDYSILFSEREFKKTGVRL
jgi:hypothetical protein